MLRTQLRRKVLGAFAAMFVAMSVGPVTHAADLMEQGKKDGLRVAFFNFKPYAYLGENGELTGTDVDTLKVVAGKMGLKIADASAIDWGALIPGIKAKRFDLVAAGMFVTAKRCAAVQFSEPTFGIKQSLIVSGGNPKGVVDYDSVAEQGLKLVAISGSAQVGYAKASGVKDGDILKVPDVATAVASMKAGRADVFALSVPGSREVIKAAKDTTLEMVTPFEKVAGELAMPHGAFAFRQSDADFVKEFNKVLTSFIGSKEHQAILVKHGMTADELPRMTTAELCNK